MLIGFQGHSIIEGKEYGTGLLESPNHPGGRGGQYIVGQIITFSSLVLILSLMWKDEILLSRGAQAQHFTLCVCVCVCGVCVCVCVCVFVCLSVCVTLFVICVCV